MTRKLALPLIIFALTAFMVTPARAAKTYRAERFDVQLDLQPGGAMIVTETVVFRFEGGDFTFAFREISQYRTDSVTFLDASMDGVPMSQGTGAGQVEVREGDPLKVTWHFAQTSDSAHEFVVRYRVEGIIRTGEADTLIWSAIPESHEYPIAVSTIMLTFPPGVRPLEAPSLDRDFNIAMTDNGAQLTTAGISADESVILTIRFPSGSLADSTPLWQTSEAGRAAVTQQTITIGFFTALATFFVGGLGLVTYIRANQRDLNLPTQIPLATPPADLPPAAAGKLTGMMHPFMGTIFDLAQRGLLEIRQDQGFWGTRNHTLVRNEARITLNPHEQGLLAAIFKPGENQVNMTEIGTRLASKSHLFDTPLEQELIQRGWLDPERKAKRSVFFAVSVFVMVAGLVLAFIGTAASAGMSANTPLSSLTAASAGFGFGAFALSIFMLIYAGTYSPLTPAGEEQKVRWLGFQDYLSQASKGREPSIRPDYFERYLAFAAVFGLGTAWAKYFQNLGGVPLPVWFHATAGNGDFGAMVAVMTASDSATSGGGDGGAGGGASGGGGSGAG